MEWVVQHDADWISGVGYAEIILILVYFNLGFFWGLSSCGQECESSNE
jgi:hypothetical protein